MSFEEKDLAVPNVFHGKTFFMPSFEIWKKVRFSYGNIAGAAEGVPLFLVYLCKLSAWYLTPS